ncbi:hypothetical protein Tco_1327601 [Tanacetum coccineum]
MFWHTARDDPMFTTIRVISKHQDTQIYGAILPQHLTNQAMLESEGYKTYHAYATGEKIPKPKYVKNKANPESSPNKKSTQASKGKRLKTSTKIKLATKRSLIPTYSSHASGLGADEGTGFIPEVPDVPTYNSDDEQISWKSSDKEDDDEVSMSKDDDENADDDQINDNVDNQGDDDQDDDNEQTESDNDDDDFWSDDEAYDEETQGVNVEGEELDEEETNKEDEVNELYRDVNVNLEGRDTEITDAPQTNVQVDVPLTTNVEKPPSSVTTLPTPPIPFIQPQQQTPVSTLINVPSTSLQNLPTFAVSLILGIIDTYLANKMNEAVKTVVQLQSDRLRDEAQAENEDFINTLDENMRKIIKKQLVNDQLEADVLTRSSNQAKTSHAVAANLSKLELKKILIDKMENNKSIDRSIQ